MSTNSMMDPKRQNKILRWVLCLLVLKKQAKPNELADQQ